MEKYFLIGVFFIVGFMAYNFYSPTCFGGECNSKITDILNPVSIQRQVDQKEVVLIDVRETDEWNSGHISGSRLISLGNLNKEATKDISKNTPIYTYCRSGRRADEAEIILKNLGFSEVKSIGGIFEWQEKGGKLIK